MNEPRATFEALEQLPIVRDYLDAFQKATGIPLRLIAANSPFVIRDSRPEFIYLAHPILIHGKHVATLTSAPAAVASMHDRRPGESQSECTFTETQIQGLGRLLAIFAQQLSECANRLLLAPRPDEPASVTRAKEYVHLHLTEDITTPQVARHVSVSRQHFCKLFRRSTGMTFTEYLARSRVERAKELLADSSCRISEIAFEAGFQTISQFNRAFRRYVGSGPGDYRKATGHGRQNAQQKRTGE